VVTRAPVAPQILGLISYGSEFVLSLVCDVPVDNEAPVVTSSINLEDLPTQCSKMLLEVVFACVY
jgi:hypothetical protein